MSSVRIEMSAFFGSALDNERIESEKFDGTVSTAYTSPEASFASASAALVMVQSKPSLPVSSVTS